MRSYEIVLSYPRATDALVNGARAEVSQKSSQPADAVVHSHDRECVLIEKVPGFAMVSGGPATDAESDRPITYPPAPEGQIIYAIGDIHGRRDLLEEVFRAIDADKARELAKERAPVWRASMASFPPATPLPSDNCSSRQPPVSPWSSDFSDEAANLRKRKSVFWRATASQTRAFRSGLGATPEEAPDEAPDTAPDQARLRQSGCTDGFALELKRAPPDAIPFESEPAPPPSFLEIYLGDYIDRGDDSRGVIDALIERGKHVDTVFLRGNHEQFLLSFLAGSLDFKTWKQFGGMPTLQSYRVAKSQFGFWTSDASMRSAFAAALPGHHARFLAETKPYFTAGSYVFAHAGIRPGIPLERQHLADLTAIRKSFLDFEGDFGHIVVHGHTPASEPEFNFNRINLDTAAYETGRLTCLKIDAEGPVLLDALTDAG